MPVMESTSKQLQEGTVIVSKHTVAAKVGTFHALSGATTVIPGIITKSEGLNQGIICSWVRGFHLVRTDGCEPLHCSKHDLRAIVPPQPSPFAKGLM